jgi:4-oxalocrotonate tautomerase
LTPRPARHYTFFKRAKKGDNMPLVTIKMVEGRNKEQKRGLVRDVTEAIARNVNCPPGAVHIDIIEYSRENLGEGGELFCDTH